MLTTHSLSQSHAIGRALLQHNTTSTAHSVQQQCAHTQAESRADHKNQPCQLVCVSARGGVCSPTIELMLRVYVRRSVGAPKPTQGLLVCVYTVVLSQPISKRCYNSRVLHLCSPEVGEFVSCHTSHTTPCPFGTSKHTHNTEQRPWCSLDLMLCWRAPPPRSARPRY